MMIRSWLKKWKQKASHRFLRTSKLAKTSSGAPSIILCEDVGYLGFRRIANAFIAYTNGKATQKIDAVAEIVWTVEVNGVPLCLSWDDWELDVTVWAWEDSGSAVVQKIYQEIIADCKLASISNPNKSE